MCEVSGVGMSSHELSQKLAEDVLASGFGPQFIRFVTHLDVNREQCAQALEVIASRCGAKAQQAWGSVTTALNLEFGVTL